MDIIDELINKIKKSEDKEICTMHKIFRDFSEELMNNYVLKFGEHEVEPVEIEFYFHMCGEHEDPFIHASIGQICTKGELYFHTKGRGGVDITFGDHKHNIIGGILLKSVNIKDDKDDLVLGQIEVGKRIEKLFSESNEQFDLIISSRECEEECNILTSRRKGLKQKGESEEIFADAPYRFVRKDLMTESIFAKDELRTIDKKRNGELLSDYSDYMERMFERYKKFENLEKDCFSNKRSKL